MTTERIFSLSEEKVWLEMVGGQTLSDVIRRRIQGIPWFLRGRGNKAARRCGRIVQRMVETTCFGPQFDRLNRESRGLQ